MFADRSDAVADDTPHRGYGVAVTPGVSGPCALITGYGPENRLLVWREGALRDVATPAVADEGRHAIGVVAADLDADGAEEIYVHNTESYQGQTRDTDLLLDPVDVLPDHDAIRWRDLFGLGINADRGNFRAGRSVAAIDRYGTGRYGVFVACYGVPSRFYELGDDGELSDMSEAVGLELDAGARSLYAGPIVTDRMDLFVGVERGPNRLFRNASGHFEEVARDAGVTAPGTNARGVTVADGDLAVGGWETRNRLFTPVTSGSERGDANAHADGGPTRRAFTDAAPPAFASPTRTRTLVAADFDNDGREELFCNALGATNRLFRKDPGAGGGPPSTPEPPRSRAASGPAPPSRTSTATAPSNCSSSTANSPPSRSRCTPSRTRQRTAGFACARPPSTGRPPGAPPSRSRPRRGRGRRSSVPARATSVRWSRWRTSVSATRRPSGSPSVGPTDAK